jgi:hypothetical protein
LAMGAGSRSEAPQTMNGDNRLLVTDEPVELQDLRKITRNFREFYKICSNLINTGRNRKMSTHNRWELEAPGF